MIFNMLPGENLSKFFGPIRGVFYGWWIVGIAAVMFTLLSITIFHGLGTLLIEFERHFFGVGHPCQEL